MSVKGLLALWIVAIALSGCETKPAPVADKAATPQPWLTGAINDRRVKLAPREGQKIGENLLRVDLGKPAGSPEEVVGLDYKQGGEERRYFRVYFTTDIGWKKACQVCGLETPYLDSREPVPSKMDGVDFRSTKVFGIPRPFQFYAFYRVAAKDAPNTQSRYFLEVDMQ